MTGDTQIPHDRGGDAAAYVLGALEPDEAATYQQHLNACGVCRDEVAALQRVADVLPLAAPQHPLPPDLRRQVLRSVRSNPRGGELARRQWRSRAALEPGLRGRGAALAGAIALLLLAAVIGVGGRSGGSVSSQVLQATVVNSPGTAQLRISGSRIELIVRHFPPPTGRPGLRGVAEAREHSPSADPSAIRRSR
jgi:anti-sigma factor RsiW